MTPVTVDPSIHGAPERPSTNSAQSSAGKPLRRRRRGRPATDRAAADAHPVAGDGDDGARFRGRPERQSAAGLRLHRPARVSAYPRDREVGTAGPGFAPNADRDRPRRYARSPMVRRCPSGPRRTWRRLPSATQCAAVRIRSPAAESSTPPVQVCSAPPPRNTAPTLGSGGTGFAVGGVLDATVAACSIGGWFAHAEVNATNSPVARTVLPAAEKRMSTDLAPTRGLAP